MNEKQRSQLLREQLPLVNERRVSFQSLGRQADQQYGSQSIPTRQQIETSRRTQQLRVKQDQTLLDSAREEHSAPYKRRRVQPQFYETDQREPITEKSAFEDESMGSDQQDRSEEMINMPSDPGFSTPGLKSQPSERSRQSVPSLSKTVKQQQVAQVGPFKPGPTTRTKKASSD